MACFYSGKSTLIGVLASGVKDNGSVGALSLTDTKP